MSKEHASWELEGGAPIRAPAPDDRTSRGTFAAATAPPWRTAGPEQLLPLALHVAGALHYMEQVGYVHLDVKPSNVYMAPEQCVGGNDARPSRAEERIGPPADVWGLGATLHHSISGERPFPREKGARESPDPLVHFPQLHSPPQPLPRPVAPDVAELIGEMLALKLGGRPSAAEVADRLEPAVARRG